MKYPIFLIALGALLWNCRPAEEEKREQVAFTMEKFRTESSGGCASDTAYCAYYEVSYPKFTGLDTAVSRALQQEIDATVSMGNPEAEGLTMKQIGEGFVQDFQEFKNDMPGKSIGWHYESEVKVEVLTDTLISLSAEEAYYTGGAHGGYGTYFINIAPRTGAAFTLDNFLKVGYQDPLTKLGEKVFRQVRDIPDSVSLAESDFEFPDDKFQLNSNYGFRKDGITFFFNSYEISSYAAGPTEILIPYTSLTDWIR